jgi:hypothetical protein
MNLPYRYPQRMQRFRPSSVTPYPSAFMDAPSFTHQILVNFNGQPMLQGLDVVQGPLMFPVRETREMRQSNGCNIGIPPLCYYNIPDPYQRQFINAASINGYYPAKYKSYI